MTATTGPTRFAVLALLLSGVFAAAAQTTQAQRPAIYSCTDANGKRLTSDRPIPECMSREQRVLNADGSVRHVVPPTLTADERADAEARERDAAAERGARQDAIRRDRNLVARFPNQDAHDKARAAALDDVRKAVRVSEARVKLLIAERKPLLDESEFYVGKPQPAKLRAQLDANDASLAAQRALIQDQVAEVSRIDALYDAELVRLKKLWAGAPAGSLAQGSKAAGTTAASMAPKAALK
ncbi:MAG: hypothetical protein M3Y67_07825 [Pseudomonadota bacterium]|nr:hypothetical protein [Pseudomonadota bacterium]